MRPPIEMIGPMPDIAAAYQEVAQRMALAAARAGRAPDTVTLVAVSKTRSAPEIREAIEAGARDLGENYVQEMVDKHELFAGEAIDLRWHAIGHLQRNKVRFIAPFCALVHSVDSPRLADEIGVRAAAHGHTQPVLLEVNIAAEDSKTGAAVESVPELAQHVADLPNVELRGLMAMTPYGAPDHVLRRLFSATRELAERIGRDLPPGSMDQLSMGMSQDYEIAVEEGATLVRVGTAIFGARQS